MTPQGILYLLGILLLVAAAVCAGIAVYLYFAKDIMSIHDDLTGKKRAKAIAEMDEEAPANRRRQQAAKAAPASAAAAAAASARRNAQAVNMDDVQATAAPKPKPRHASDDSGDTAPEASETVTQVESEAAETVLAVNVGLERDDTTVVAGHSDPLKEPNESRVAEELRASASASFKVVRKIVLADSAEFIDIG